MWPSCGAVKKLLYEFQIAVILGLVHSGELVQAVGFQSADELIPVLQGFSADDELGQHFGVVGLEIRETGGDELVLFHGQNHSGERGHQTVAQTDALGPHRGAFLLLLPGRQRIHDQEGGRAAQSTHHVVHAQVLVVLDDIVGVVGVSFSIDGVAQAFQTEVLEQIAFLTGVDIIQPHAGDFRIFVVMA